MTYMKIISEKVVNLPITESFSDFIVAIVSVTQ